MTATKATTPRHRLDMAGMIRELTEPHTHTERYERQRGGTIYRLRHTTTVPPLITQLWAAGQVNTMTAGADGLRPGYRSRPAARLEAMDVAARIDLAVARWVRDLGEDDPGDRLDPRGRVIRGSGTIACLRLLRGLLPSAAEVTRHAVGDDVRSWWTQARVVTGWDSPAWKPAASCPVCGKRGGLRVHLLAEAGFCVECHATWGPGTVGMLAEHIRAEAERDDGAAGEAGQRCECGSRWCGSDPVRHAERAEAPGAGLVRRGILGASPEVCPDAGGP